MMNLIELRKLTVESLQEEAHSVRYQIGSTGITVRSGQSKASHALVRLRKYLAQILTIITEKALKN